MSSKSGQGRCAVLYAGGQTRRNAPLHEALLDLARRGPAAGRRRVRMAYVPFTARGAGTYYRRFERRYRAFGGTDFRHVPADLPDLARPGPARRRAAEALLGSDIVYLAGGNTFYFLLHLKRSGLAAVLQQFAARGGVLAGMSAGAHLLTPHIELAGYPPFDRDENEVRLPRGEQDALDLVGFEFFPHYRHSPRYRHALAAYVRRQRRVLYACRDGGGLVVEGDHVTPYGDVWRFDPDEQQAVRVQGPERRTKR